MQTLYNCRRIDAKHYRITKFDSGFVQFEHHDGTISSYICSESGCDCPQGHKPSCRHRKMLPMFIEHDHIGDGWFFIWDTHQWLKPTGIFAEAAEEADRLNVEELVDTMKHVGIETVVVDERTFEGGQLPVSAVPSPQPSHKPFRRMR